MVNMPLPKAVHLRWGVDAYDGIDWPLITAGSRYVTQAFSNGSYSDINGDSIRNIGEAVWRFRFWVV